jgi:hypothetical protein
MRSAALNNSGGASAEFTATRMAPGIITGSVVVRNHDDLIWPFQSSAAPLRAARSGTSGLALLVVERIEEQIEPLSHSGMGEYGVAHLLIAQSAGLRCEGDGS